MSSTASGEVPWKRIVSLAVESPVVFGIESMCV
jgi:hypothetical protein